MPDTLPRSLPRLPLKTETIKRYWLVSQPYLATLVIFLSSRLLVLLAVFFSRLYVPQNPNGEYWNANPHWYRFFLRYDSGWYLTIARHGYRFDGNNLAQQPIVFYPVYPLLARFFHYAFGMDYNAAVFMVANVSILLAVLVCYRLLSEDYGKQVSYTAIALLSFFPTSYFFSAGYTESLTFLLIVTTLLLLKHKRFLLASCFAGLAAGTRATGLVLLLPILWELWRYYRPQPARLLAYAAGCMVLATSGFWLFVIFLWKSFGSPLAFASNQQAWDAGHSGDLLRAVTLRPFVEHLSDILYEGPVPNALDPWMFILFFALLVFFRKRISTSFVLFALGVLLLPYFTRAGSTVGFQSMLRYLVLAFPVFIIMADLVKERAWAAFSLLGLFAGMLFMYSAMFAQWYWIG
jgi:hypothetical protein